MTLYAAKKERAKKPGGPWDGMGYTSLEKLALTWQAKQLRFVDGMYERAEKTDEEYRKEAMNMDIRGVVNDYRDSQERNAEYAVRVNTRKNNERGK